MNTYVINQNGILQHRVVVEKYLGRPLKQGEVVHHINEDKSDNRIVNLVVFESNGEHLRFHKKKDQSNILGWHWRKRSFKGVMCSLYNKYGIILYGPLYAKHIEKNAMKALERMKKDLRLRESEVS